MSNIYQGIDRTSFLIIRGELFKMILLENKSKYGLNSQEGKDLRCYLYRDQLHDVLPNSPDINKIIIYRQLYSSAEKVNKAKKPIAKFKGGEMGIKMYENMDIQNSVVDIND